MFTKKEIKERGWAKKKAKAKFIYCGCGCGEKILEVDDYGRKKTYISGHNGSKYATKNGHKNAWYHRHKKKRVDHIRRQKKKYRNLKKVRLLKLKGSECVKCGVKFDGTNAAMFDFHHTDENKKNFSLGACAMNNKSWDKIVKEAEKCILLCANCHRLTHFGQHIINRSDIDDNKRT